MKGVVLMLVAASAFVMPRPPVTHTSMNTIKIILRPNESVDSAIMRLRREVNKSGHLRTLRTKRYHEDKREKYKRKQVESRRKLKFFRQLKKRASQRAP